MKQLIFLVILALTVASCKKDDPSEGFELQYLLNLEIPAGLNPIQAHFWELYDIPTNFVNQADLANVPTTEVQRIHSNFLNLNLRNPASADFKWIERMYLYINTDSLPQAEIGYLEFVPNNVENQLTLIPSQTDLKDYLSGDNFDLIVEIQPLITSPLTTSNSLDLTFFAHTTE